MRPKTRAAWPSWVANLRRQDKSDSVESRRLAVRGAEYGTNRSVSTNPNRKKYTCFRTIFAWPRRDGRMRAAAVLESKRILPDLLKSRRYNYKLFPRAHSATLGDRANNHTFLRGLNSDRSNHAAGVALAAVAEEKILPACRAQIG